MRQASELARIDCFITSPAMEPMLKDSRACWRVCACLIGVLCPIAECIRLKRLKGTGLSEGFYHHCEIRPTSSGSKNKEIKELRLSTTLNTHIVPGADVRPELDHPVQDGRPIILDGEHQRRHAGGLRENGKNKEQTFQISKTRAIVSAI